MSNGMKSLRIGEQIAGTIRNVNPTESATNCVNQNGTIRFLDGQIGGQASFEGFKKLFFLRTN